MEPLHKVQRFFQYFDAVITKVEMQEDPISMSYFDQTVQSYGRRRVTMTTDFYTDQGVDRLIRFLDNIEAAEVEARLRAANPTLQKAYEEYQILLKLIK